VEKASFGGRNIVIGNPDTAKVLYTAHYDTCARLPFPNFITPKNIFIYLSLFFPISLNCRRSRFSLNPLSRLFRPFSPLILPVAPFFNVGFQRFPLNVGARSSYERAQSKRN
jgi:hypothetical protein